MLIFYEEQYCIVQYANCLCYCVVLRLVDLEFYLWGWIRGGVSGVEIVQGGEPGPLSPCLLGGAFRGGSFCPTPLPLPSLIFSHLLLAPHTPSRLLVTPAWWLFLLPITWLRIVL